jgi:ankyrin repeat protein
VNNGATPVFVAAQNGHVDVLALLAEQGCNLSMPMNDGATPVFIAAQQGTWSPEQRLQGD